jgi:tight adherence protein B
VTTAVLATILAALIAARVGRRLLRVMRPLGDRSQTVRRAREPLSDYANLLDAIARQVRSGASLTTAAIEEIEQTSPLGAVIDQLATGRSFGDALATIASADADLALTVQALSAGTHLGGPVAATLDQAAAVLRERAAVRAERRAHSAQARISARVLTIVPLGFALWSAISNQRTRDVYASTAAGGTCAVLGLALNLAGWQWMNRIVGPR